MTIEYAEPRAPKASRPVALRWRALPLVVGVAATVASLLLLVTNTNPDDLRVIAAGCSTESQTLSQVEKTNGAKSPQANAARDRMVECRARLKAAQDRAPSIGMRQAIDALTFAAVFGTGIGVVLFLSVGSRVTDLGERARVQSRKVRGLPPKEPTIRIPPPAPRVEAPTPEPLQQTFPMDDVVDYPEDTDSAPVDEPPRARSGWGTASKRKLTFGDEDGEA